MGNTHSLNLSPKIAPHFSKSWRTPASGRSSKAETNAKTSKRNSRSIRKTSISLIFGYESHDAHTGVSLRTRSAALNERSGAKLQRLPGPGELQRDLWMGMGQ